jgi:hypothetical protein
VGALHPLQIFEIPQDKYADQPAKKPATPTSTCYVCQTSAIGSNSFSKMYTYEKEVLCNVIDLIV